MTRLVSALSNDVRLQVRYGLYAVSGLMILIWGLLLGFLTRATPLPADALVPPLVVMNLLITTFYFMAGLVLFEKSEGVLTALVTTPLRTAEYLLSKGLTLAFLGTAETLLIVVFIFGRGAITWRLTLASLLLGLFYAMAGFMTVVRFQSINGFLVPSVPAAMLVIAPLLAHFEVVEDATMAWHPAQPMLLLMRGGGVLAVLAALVWCALAVLVARQQFERFVVRA